MTQCDVETAWRAARLRGAFGGRAGLARRSADLAQQMVQQASICASLSAAPRATPLARSSIMAPSRPRPTSVRRSTTSSPAGPSRR